MNKLYRFTPDITDYIFEKSNLDAYGLTPNKIYQVIDIKNRNYHKSKYNKNQIFLNIINDRGESCSFSEKWFKPIDIEREEKLKQLNI